MLLETLFGDMFKNIDRSSEDGGYDYETAMHFYLALVNAR